MELNRAVAENIKRIRKQQKLSLERTAALSGVSRSMLGQIERGEANPIHPWRSWESWRRR